MKVVTFGGNFCYFPMMGYDLVYVDDDYVQCKEKVVHPNIVHLNSGFTGDDDISRRYRIAFMLREIFARADDHILLVDSDVYIPPVKPVAPASFCIPARAKPGNDIIMFCMSTNIYVPISFAKFVNKVMDDYIKQEIYKSYYVDIYLHFRLLSTIRTVPGTCHWILGVKYCINDQYKIVQTF